MAEITKILIANRGEIACRVMKTARRMGIATVAVYSDADRDALHVRMADEAVPIGPAPAAESYLVIDTIIDAAKRTGADAVHPGYGFLSENPDFVRALDAAGITFIGPSADAIEAMGLKDRAKDLMAEAGVPITPGYQGEDQNDAVLAKAAKETGYPVLIKAVAGGGGKGMRKVEDPSGFAEALASARREAQASFGNDRVLIEKFVATPRHIEVQVFGDSHGHVVHMFERDCSLQRRHQKVIEEAPAPGMPDDVRAAMTEAAVKAAQAVDYEGAGTVEFIVDGSGELRTDGFYFMEMNTRLQVEHPVTEAITGLDLVEWQIRVARGEELPAQDDITMKGHAVEARLYAEDPANDFRPGAGRVEVLRLPSDMRVDTGIEEGGVVSRYYDPMIAKLIARGASRRSAIDRLQSGCARALVYPIKSNADFLAALLADADFRQGRLHTGLIDGFDYEPSVLEESSLVAAIGPQPGSGVFGALSGFRLNLPARRRFTAFVDGKVRTLPLREGEARVGLVSHGGRYAFVGAPANLLDDAVDQGALTAPMPGKVISVAVAPGDEVADGQTLLVLEAMKMEMAIKAPRDGVVAEVAAEAGQLVQDGDVLVSLQE